MFGHQLGGDGMIAELNRDVLREMVGGPTGALGEVFVASVWRPDIIQRGAAR